MKCASLRKKRMFKVFTRIHNTSILFFVFFRLVHLIDDKDVKKVKIFYPILATNMSRKTLFTGILCFVCGMLIGYATSLLTTNDDDHVRKRLKRNLSDNNDLVKTLRKDFEKEIHVLYEKLDAIHQELQLNKNKKINNKRNSDISSDETDQAECFYDTAEM